jgi:alkylation response protein AidB-like acyl-CoA dehydrogenase
VRLEAATAFIEETARRLDSGEKDLQVEGSIAKLFATESANKAAEDAMQALGGYGYINEFEVEKIKRDVKITCIYEGTSEIQQNIISTFRWKKTRKTKGTFYADISAEMEALDAAFVNAGCRFYALAADALNKAISLVHDHQLIRQQYIMFALADMSCHVEIGASLARKAKSFHDAGDTGAEKLKIVSKLFAGQVAELMVLNLFKIIRGCGRFEEKDVAEFLTAVSHHELTLGFQDSIGDMDALADIIFER